MSVKGTFRNLYNWTARKRILIPLTITFSYPSFLILKFYLSKKEKVPLKQIITQLPPQKFIHRNFWRTIIFYLYHSFRFIQLIFIFTPPLFLLPLKFFQKTYDYWLETLMRAIERAGVVWIKGCQYMSHRRDILGSQLADKFGRLRENAPTHSYKETQRCFRDVHGKSIQQIFEQFDKQPIASGSVSQVYKAIYKGKTVVVKVRHPDVEKHIQADINIIFGVSKFLSFFSKSLELPVGENSLKKTLVDQMDLTIERENLKTFNRMFSNSKLVAFPHPLDSDSSHSVLIQSFIEGMPITYYEQNPHPLNEVIARYGVLTYFEMLMKNNYTHADCHGGNIFVEIQQNKSSFLEEIWNYIKYKYIEIQSKLVQSVIENETLRALYAQSKKQELRIRRLISQATNRVKLNVIDVGMVISLNELDRQNFLKFLQAMVEGTGKGCAQIIYNLSSYHGVKLNQGQFKQYYHQLQKAFSVMQNQNYHDWQGMDVLRDVLNIVRLYNMKLNGDLATMVTNMFVLESMAKQVDPNINLMKMIIPFFTYTIEKENQPKGQFW